MQAYDRRATFCVETRFMARINIPFSVVLDTRESTRKGQNQRMILRSLLERCKPLAVCLKSLEERS